MLLGRYRARTSERPGGADSLARYNFALKFTEDKEVLDIGTGLGGGADHIAANGAKSVLGIDNSRNAIEWARRNYSRPNLRFEAIDAVSPHPIGAFDVIIAFELIEHLCPETHEDFLDHVRKMLRPGGVFLLSTPNKLLSSPGRPKPRYAYHLKEFEPQELLGLLNSYFGRVSLYGIRCVNERYIAQAEELQLLRRHRLLSYFGQYRMIWELAAYLPRGLKRRLMRVERLPSLGVSDFQISNHDVDKSAGLLVVCRLC